MKPILYVHGGSGNHGCEALVRTLSQLFSNSTLGTPIVLTANIKEDRKYKLEDSVSLISPSKDICKLNFNFLSAYLKYKLFGKFIYLDMLPWKRVIDKFTKDDVAFAIGGDSYSYSYTEDNPFMHEMFRKKGMRTVLLGCSITPELMDDYRVLSDIMNFDIIFARESITYNALLQHGLKNVELIPDSAFILPRYECNESSLIKPGKTIGLNVSPMAISYEKGENIVLSNYDLLIEYLLSSTDNDVALIPHVVWEKNDDRKVLSILFDKYKDTGRVIMIHDHNCMELKDIIARCRFFIGARTHATIAAYSSCVPTLALGYSVKAKGIAKDIFGTYKNYVLPVESIKSANCLTESFKWMQTNEQSILEHYEKVMPSYIESVHKSQEILKQYLIKNE